MRFWWVNQNQTYRHEVPGGYLWSPKTRKDGGRHYFYDTMTEVRPGDLVFSFADTYIKALGVVQSLAQTATKPTEFGQSGAAWADEGWFVEVNFIPLKERIRPKDHISQLRDHLPQKYSPLQSTGDGNQVVYLTELPEPLALVLGKLIGPEYSAVTKAAIEEEPTGADDVAEETLSARADIPETQKLQLIRARRGQGLFRSRVELVEAGCRVSGLTDRQHLRASHIMPWRVANDAQKLDGNNGLMLSPHVDHLFDKGFISFADGGSLLISAQVPDSLIKAWMIQMTAAPRPFNEQQAGYLKYHRDELFRG